MIGSKGNGLTLFKKTQVLETKINTFLQNIETSGELYSNALVTYFKGGKNKVFSTLKQEITQAEQQNDALRREIESQLYVQMILPDMRSDILRILEGCDKIINKYESNLIDLSIERIQIPFELHEGILKMLHFDLLCVFGLIQAVRAFFDGRSLHGVTDDIFKNEHVVDLIAESLKEQVFSDSTLDLARQLQLKDFIHKIEKISDIAEDVADRLMIMSVKHAL